MKEEEYILNESVYRVYTKIQITNNEVATNRRYQKLVQRRRK